MKTIYTLLLLSIACLLGGAAWGQVNISPSATVTQDFNTMGSSATATLPAGWKVDNSSNMVRTVGTYIGAGTVTTQMGGANIAANAQNGIYNFGNSVTTTDRALGGLSGGGLSKSVNIYVDLFNTGSSAIPSFTLSYGVEKYRNGSNPSGFTVQLFYSTDGSTWTSAGSNFTTSIAADGDNLGYATTPGSTINISSKNLSVTLAASSHLYLAWNYSVSSGSTISSAQALGIDDISITAGSALITPPTLTPAASATVDNPFAITFTDDASWRAAINSITVNGSTLPTSAYSTTSAGQITFNPALDASLQSTGTKNIIIYATGYNNGNVSQTINPGVPANLIVATQPIGPTANGGTLTTQPVVGVKDQYSNPVIAGYTINASVPAAQTSNWALGGTTTATTNSSGNASFTGLTATNNTAAPYSANITFSYGSVNATSNAFTIPSTAPTLTAASGATVDNPFAVTFTDNASWRAAISSITVGGTLLPATAYSTTTVSQIIFTPSASVLLQTAGTKAIVIIASGYNNASVSQPISAGAPATLTITKQPAAPTTYTGTLSTQPVVKTFDQYGNVVSGSYTITAAVSTGQVGSWTLGGTTGVNTGSGVATYTNLIATNLIANAYSATITFSYGSASVTSNAFIIPAPPPSNDDCSNAITLTAAASPVAVTGTFVSSALTAGLSTDTAKNDVWYKFIPPCTGLDSIRVDFTGTGRDLDFEVFAVACPSSGVGFVTSLSNNSTSESKKSSYTAGTVYYIRVIQNDNKPSGTFTINIYTLPPAQPSSISGNPTPCLGSAEIYSVSPIIAGVTYNWTLPGATWSGSLTGSSINVVVGSDVGNLTVTPNNTCGLSGPPLTYAVSPITAPLNVTGVSVNPGNGRVSIAWTNPPNCFDEIMVIATDNSGNITLVPTGNGSQYVDTTEFASQIKDNSINMNVGEYCIYKGTSSATIMTGLLNGNPYNIKIFTRWGTQWSSGVIVSGILPAAAFNGDYRSVKSGLWNDYTTWNKLVSGNWVSTSGSTDYPSDYLSNVYIEPGTVVQLNTSPVAVRNLEVKARGQLWTSTAQTTNKYVTVFGDIICDGTIGNTNPNALDYIGFNIEGGSCTISGAGTFGCARIRKEFTAGTTGGINNTTLNINKDINLFWNGTALYNDADNDTLSYPKFNVNLNPGYKLTLKNPAGNVAIDGTSGYNLNSHTGGKFTVLGTLTIPGVLYLTTDNSTSGPACTFEIGTGGKVITNIVKLDASGTATHTLTMRSGSWLTINDTTGQSAFSQKNNVLQLLTGSTIEYSAPANINQFILSGISYYNLLLSGAGTKTISPIYSSITVNGALTINPNNALSIGAESLTLNGTVAGTGTITGSGTSNLIIGPNNTLTTTPLGVLRFTPGHDSLGTLTMDRQMKADVYPTHKYWAAVLGSNLNVSTLTLNQGILATNTYLLTLLNYPASTYAAYNGASYIATTDTLATAFNIGNTFNGSFGLRINGVKANTDTYFPVGADFISPNRVYIKLNSSAPTRNLTVALTKGDIIRTGSPRVNRIWYMNSSVNDSVNAAMRLYYTGYSLASYPYLVKQDELETGFTGLGVRLVEKANMSDTYFTNISNGADTMVNFSPGTEVYAKYTASVSTIYNGTKPGIYKFNVFSIVDGNNVVLPVNFTSIRAYQQGTGINISWSVANEVGIDHYEVERAGDARLFSTIASQKAQNTNSYTATDMQPLKAANYYRIKAVGKDGQVLYSTVVNVTLGSDGKMSIVVYPNPVKFNQCHVLLNNLAAGNYNIAVYSMAGQLITTKQVEHPGGSSSEKLYLPAGTAAGVYVVKISGQNVTMQTSVFVSGK